MKKSPLPRRLSSAYTSPGTPEYNQTNVGKNPKSWSSERVPLPTHKSKKYDNALLPFYSRKNRPSKWDDAERWITSPISVDNNPVRAPSTQEQRRPKSKSGPLGPPGVMHPLGYSPLTPGPESRGVRSPIGDSPLPRGLLVPDDFSIHYNATGIGGKLDSLCGLSDVAWGRSLSLLPSSEDDDKLGVGKVEDNARVSGVLHGLDTTTQMGPHKNANLPPFSSRSISNLDMKDEIRDVQVDRGTNTARELNRQGVETMKKDEANNLEVMSLPWNGSEEAKCASRLQREDAKITAWENLQKAKAEAAIRRLEMKLEKKRSASMDTIVNKLRATQMKAAALRNSLSENHKREAPTLSCSKFSCCACVEACSVTNSHTYRMN